MSEEQTMPTRDILESLSKFNPDRSVFYLEYYDNGRKRSQYVAFDNYRENKLNIKNVPHPILFSDIVKIGKEISSAELANAMNNVILYS